MTLHDFNCCVALSLLNPLRSIERNAKGLEKRANRSEFGSNLRLNLSANTKITDSISNILEIIGNNSTHNQLICRAMTSPKPVQPPSPRPDLQPPTFRSGAVARMAGMPVATLRIWEQRYQAVRPTTAASGHRLYSSADIERVSLLRQLTEQGHAIGLLAALGIGQLRHMREMMPVPKVAASGNWHEAAPQPLPMRIVVVGQALARRLQRLVERQPGRTVLEWVGVFDSLAEAAQAAPRSAEHGVDLLLWQAASLQPGARHELRVAQNAWGAPATAVVYRYASAAGRAELTGAGAAMLHEPADDESLGQWLTSLERRAATAGDDRRGPDLAHPAAMDPADRLASAPRFADAALTEFAGLSSAMACECPSHLAQLLLQISNFETYSGDCAHRSAADAQLHAYLQRVAGAARMLFETALEHVAIAEGLPLPASPDGKTFSAVADVRRAPAVF